MSLSVEEQVFLVRLENQLNRIETQLKHMATQADIEAALQTLQAAIASAAAAIQTKLNSLQAQITAGASGPDLAPQLSEIQADTAAMAALGNETPAPAAAPAS